MAKNRRAAQTNAWSFITPLGSTRVFIGLLSALASAAGCGTFLHAGYGADYARWHVYHSGWFTCLLAALALNVAFSALSTLPWRWANASRLLLHVGLLGLLIGGLMTRLHGVDGEITLLEGAATDQLTLPRQSQLTLSWVDRPQEPPYVFTFDSGPNDWQRGTELSLGQVDGVAARVLDFFRDPQPLEHMVVDTNGRGGPLIRFEVKGLRQASTIRSGLNANAPLKGSLADVDYGAEVLVGPVAVRLQRAASDAMLAEFLHPQNEHLGDKGVLTAYYEESVERVNVDEQVGKVVKVGSSGAAVELVQYLANAKLDAKGRFQSIGTDARNPLVELKVTLPSDDKPFRQVAFAKSPLLNFDGVYGRDCPVKFTYQHPQLKPGAALEFMKARDGKLFGRTITDGIHRPLGEIKIGAKIDLKGGLVFTISDYLPHTRRDISFQRASQNTSSELSRSSPAAQFEVSDGGSKKTIWLQRDEPPYNVGTIDTPTGQLRVRFAKAHIPLGFGLELVKVEPMTELVHGDDKPVASDVRVVDKPHTTNEESRVLAGQPLSYNNFRIYQSQVRDAGHGKQLSTLNVVYDPGRIWKIMGSVLMCVGVCGIAITKADQSHGKSASNVGEHPPLFSPPQQAAKKSA